MMVMMTTMIMMVIVTVVVAAAAVVVVVIVVVGVVVLLLLVVILLVPPINKFMYSTGNLPLQIQPYFVHLEVFIGQCCDNCVVNTDYSLIGWSYYGPILYLFIYLLKKIFFYICCI